MGAMLVARIEAIAVNQINNRNKLNGCYLNFCDATLLELWRVQQGKNSLNGYCALPIAQDNVTPQNAESEAESDSEDFSSDLVLKHFSDVLTIK